MNGGKQEEQVESRRIVATDGQDGHIRLRGLPMHVAIRTADADQQRQLSAELEAFLAQLVERQFVDQKSEGDHHDS